jgi:hypothetical protein
MHLRQDVYHLIYMGARSFVVGVRIVSNINRLEIVFNTQCFLVTLKIGIQKNMPEFKKYSLQKNIGQKLFYHKMPSSAKLKKPVSAKIM